MERNQVDFGVLGEVQMMTLTWEGRERSVPELQQLLRDAGFGLGEVYETPVGIVPDEGIAGG